MGYAISAKGVGRTRVAIGQALAFVAGHLIGRSEELAAPDRSAVVALGFRAFARGTTDKVGHGLGSKGVGIRHPLSGFTSGSRTRSGGWPAEGYGVDGRQRNGRHGQGWS